MVRVLFEISLPGRTLARVASALGPGALPQGVAGRIEVSGGLPGCESPAQGGAAQWTPCWISLEADRPSAEYLDALRRVRQTVVEAAHEGNVELFAIPAAVQIGEEYRRIKDILGVADHLP